MSKTLCLQTEPAQFHLPPWTGLRSVDSHFLWGVVVVTGARVVVTTLLSASTLPGELSGFADEAKHLGRAVAEPATFQE